ncbi:MAG: hypothetical protein IT370_26670 [Deltaproteobacteria bacterium]|nr:hypothetical protein [Deltaproteobacteria bacterium]
MWIGVLACLAAATADASGAGVRVGVIVLNQADGQQQAARLAPLLRRLTTRGFMTPERVAAALAERSAPGDSLNLAQLDATTKAIESGYSSFLRGDFEVARQALSQAIADLLRKPATVARQQPLRDTLLRAYMGLALSHSRLGDSARAEAVMTEFLRSMPDREISRATYGPEPIELAKRIRAAWASRPRGALRVQTDDPTAVIFLDERYVGVGDVTLPDLWPGSYRVYVQRGKTEGRVHTVEVTPAKETGLEVQARLDAAVRIVGDAVALVFASTAARDAEAHDRARELAATLDAAQVITIGADLRDGGPVIVGAVVDPLRATPERRASIAADALDASGEALIDYLLDGKQSPAVHSFEAAATSVAEKPPVALRARRGGGGLRVAGWVAASAGVLALGGGIYYGLRANELEDEVSSPPAWSNDLASKVDEGETAAFRANLLIGVGAAAVVGGGVLLYLGYRSGASESRPGRTQVQGLLAPGLAGVLVQGSFQ